MNHVKSLPLSHSTFEVAGVLLLKNIVVKKDRMGDNVLRGSLLIRVNDDDIDVRIYLKRQKNNTVYQSAYDVLHRANVMDNIHVRGRYAPATYWNHNTSGVVQGQHQFHGNEFVLEDCTPMAVVRMAYYPMDIGEDRVSGYVMTTNGIEPVSAIIGSASMSSGNIYNVDALVTKWNSEYDLRIIRSSMSNKQYSAKDMWREIDAYKERVLKIAHG